MITLEVEFWFVVWSVSISLISYLIGLQIGNKAGELKERKIWKVAIEDAVMEVKNGK